MAAPQAVLMDSTPVASAPAPTRVDAVPTISFSEAPALGSIEPTSLSLRLVSSLNFSHSSGDIVKDKLVKAFPIDSSSLSARPIPTESMKSSKRVPHLSAASASEDIISTASFIASDRPLAILFFVSEDLRESAIESPILPRVLTCFFIAAIDSVRVSVRSSMALCALVAAWFQSSISLPIHCTIILILRIDTAKFKAVLIACSVKVNADATLDDLVNSVLNLSIPLAVLLVLNTSSLNIAPKLKPWAFNMEALLAPCIKEAPAFATYLVAFRAAPPTLCKPSTSLSTKDPLEAFEIFWISFPNNLKLFTALSIRSIWAWVAPLNAGVSTVGSLTPRSFCLCKSLFACERDDISPLPALVPICLPNSSAADILPLLAIALPRALPPHSPKRENSFLPAVSCPFSITELTPEDSKKFLLTFSKVCPAFNRVFE